MSNFTPGPWTTRGTFVETQNEKNKDGVIASANNEANAKLIAAAPDLLKFIQDLIHGDIPKVLEVEALELIERATGKE